MAMKIIEIALNKGAVELDNKGNVLIKTSVALSQTDLLELINYLCPFKDKDEVQT